MFFIRTYWLYLLLPILLFVLAIGLFQIDGLYGQDAYAYLKFTNALRDFWGGGIKPDDFFWPILYPFISSLVSFFTGRSALALQLVSVLSLAGAMIYLHVILQEKFKNILLIRIYLISFFLFSPFILKMSLLCMSDMLCLFFIAAHLGHYVRFKNRSKSVDLLLSVLFGVAAVFTRYGAAVLVLFTLLHIGILLIKSRDFIRIGICFIGLLIGLLPHLIFTSRGYLNFTNHQWLADWNILNMFKSSFQTNDGNMHFMFPNIIFYFLNIFHPGHLIILVPLILILIFRRSGLYQSFLLIPLIIYFLFISGIPTQNIRFLLPLMIYLIILLFPAVEKLYEQLPFKKIILLFCVVANSVLFILGFVKLYQRIQFEQEVISLLNSKYVGRNVFSFDMDQSIEGRGYRGKTLGLFEKVYPDIEKGSLILFNPDKFKIQWEGKPPMQNWEKVNENHKLNVVQKFRDGWSLYEVY